MRTIEAQGKSIDEAIFNGLRELEISIDEVDIEIIRQESKGVLGIGARNAIVRLIEREPEKIIVPEYLTEEAKKRRDERANEPRERGGRYEHRRDDRQGGYKRRDDRPHDNAAPRQGSFQRREEPFVDPDRINSRGEHVLPASNRRPSQPRQQQGYQPRPQQNFQPHQNAPMQAARSEEDMIPAKEKLEYTLEAAQNDQAGIFLQGLLQHMGVEGEVLANVKEAEGDEAANTHLCIKAENMGVLIGHRGETLDALQYLTSLCVNRSRKEKGYTRITIDTEGYRDKREETLTRLAHKVASQVKATGRPRTMEPMNPYERRIFHATLQNNPYVTTHSEGEEPYRRVVVQAKR